MKNFFSNITALHRDFCEIQVQTLPKAKRARELRAFAKTTANRNSSVCDTFIESRTTNLSVLHKLHDTRLFSYLIHQTEQSWIWHLFEQKPKLSEQSLPHQWCLKIVHWIDIGGDFFIIFSLKFCFVFKLWLFFSHVFVPLWPS